MQVLLRLPQTSLAPVWLSRLVKYPANVKVSAFGDPSLPAIGSDGFLSLQDVWAWEIAFPVRQCARYSAGILSARDPSSASEEKALQRAPTP